MLKPSTGLEQQIDPVMDVLFVPFNLRFQSLLARLNEHKILFAVDLSAGRYRLLTAFTEKVIQHLKEREDFVQDNRIRRYLTKERDDCKCKRIKR